jgi:hypothetical protein
MIDAVTLLTIDDCNTMFGTHLDSLVELTLKTERDCKNFDDDWLHRC